MSSKRWIAVALLFVGASALWSGDEQSSEDLALQYAEKKRALAELNLQVARDLRSHQGISAVMLQRFASRLAVAEAQQDQAFRRSTDQTSHVQQKHAEERLRIASLRLQALVDHHSEQTTQTRRRVLERDLADLHLQLLKQSRSAQTPLAYMQWQLDWMVDELISLDQRLSLLESQPSVP